MNVEQGKYSGLYHDLRNKIPKALNKEFKDNKFVVRHDLIKCMIDSYKVKIDPLDFPDRGERRDMMDEDKLRRVTSIKKFVSLIVLDNGFKPYGRKYNVKCYERI